MSTVAHFDIAYTRFLNPEGVLSPETPDAAKQSPEEWLALYRVMTLIRLFDYKAINQQRTGKMGTYASVLGQEAIGTALGRVMQPKDVLCPFYRDYAAQYQRGVKLSELYSYWGGDERGSCFANNAEDLPISVPIASQCLHASGIAYAFKLRKQPRVAVSVCGDGGTSQGDFYEAMNVAGVWKLPSVFVINNNQWAISVPLSAQTACQTLAQKAIAAGFEGEQVDGNDIVACRYVFEKALEKARRGDGPTLIEAITYRLCDHTTADDASRYRDKNELETAWKNEPIVRLRRYLESEGVWNEEKENALQSACTEEIDAAVQEYLALKPQSVSSIFDFMYERWPENLKEQRDFALALEKETQHG